MSTSPAYDVVFVGAGISGTFTLVELLHRLEAHPATPARLLVIDRDAELFTGTPYGRRSGDVGLIISRAADFLPTAHAETFARWLAADRDRIFERFFAGGGALVETWRAQYWADVEAGELDELYLPRYVFGMYFAELARAAIAEAQRTGAAQVDTVAGEVVDLERTGGGLTVVTRAQRYPAERVVLALGGAPSRSIEGGQQELVIDDPFEPGIADMLARVRAALAQKPGGEILIVGSNAGALDVIFNLMNDPEIGAGTGRIEVMSPSGRLPELFHTQPAGTRPPFPYGALKALAAHDTIRADDILAAVGEDIDSARRDGLTITDTFGDISIGFNSLIDRLSPEEKLRFACDTGPRIGALQRKVGHDYWEVLDALTRDGRLAVRRGRYPDDSGDGADRIAVINCSGSERLSAPGLHSELLRALLDRGSVRATGSDLGIEVDDDMQSGLPGVYVMGPMLTGNVIGDYPAWNLEHCGRIALFAGILADHLVESASAERAG